MSHVAITPETVPNIWFKAQRVLRTAFTTILTLLPLVPQIVQIIQGQWSVEWLTAVGVQAVAINAALTAIIAIPVVNAWLTKVGLGSVPRSAVTGTGPEVDVKAIDNPLATAAALVSEANRRGE